MYSAQDNTRGTKRGAPEVSRVCAQRMATAAWFRFAVFWCNVMPTQPWSVSTTQSPPDVFAARGHGFAMRDGRVKRVRGADSELSIASDVHVDASKKASLPLSFSTAGASASDNGISSSVLPESELKSLTPEGGTLPPSSFPAQEQCQTKGCTDDFVDLFSPEYRSKINTDADTFPVRLPDVEFCSSPWKF